MCRPRVKYGVWDVIGQFGDKCVFLYVSDGAVGVSVHAADGDRVGEHVGPHHAAVTEDAEVEDELLHHAPGPGGPERGPVVRVHRHRVEGDDDLGGGPPRLQDDTLPPGRGHVRLHLRPGGPQHRQIRRHHPPHGFHRKL